MPKLLNLVEDCITIAVNHPLSIWRADGVDEKLSDFPGYMCQVQGLSISVIFPAADYSYICIKQQEKTVFRAEFYSEYGDFIYEEVKKELYYSGEWENSLEKLLEETYDYINKPKSAQLRLLEKDYFW